MMVIKFVCGCGKRLRARNEMAGRRSACPRCGAPVGVPSLQPTVRGATQGPMSPAERIWARRVARSIDLSIPEAAPAAEVATVSSVDGSAIMPDTVLVQHPGRHPAARLVRQVRRRPWRLEEMERHWYQCLFYPLRAWPLVLGLALVLSGFSGGMAFALPSVLADFRAEASWLLWVCLPCLASLLICGYATGFLDCTLTSAMTGEVRRIRWPGRDVGLALKSGTRWLICFFVGPHVPAGAGAFFWIHGGDLQFLDWIILGETHILALSCWLLLVWTVNEKDRLRDLHPVRVGELIHRLGRRLVALAVGASILGLAHAWLAGVALEKVHLDVALGWSLLFLCWVSGMFFATFLFRCVGVWLYWDRVRAKQEHLFTQANRWNSE